MNAQPEEANRVKSATRGSGQIWNIPNALTALRIGMCFFLFFALHFHAFGWGLSWFVLAASTDWLDGFLARRWQQVTQLGRIMDPIADKVLICGTYVFLSAIENSKIAPWMAVVIMTREFMVTVIRSFLEQHGKDFSAAMAGKLKMVLQSITAAIALTFLWQTGDKGGQFDTWQTAIQYLAWATVALTVYSGIVYLPAAGRLLREI